MIMPGYLNGADGGFGEGICHSDSERSHGNRESAITGWKKPSRAGQGAADGRSARRLNANMSVGYSLVSAGPGRHLPIPTNFSAFSNRRSPGMKAAPSRTDADPTPRRGSWGRRLTTRQSR